MLICFVCGTSQRKVDLSSISEWLRSIRGEKSRLPNWKSESSHAMANGYSLVYAEQAADFLLSLKRSKLTALLYDLRCLALDPFVRSDYRLDDGQGRQIEHLLIDEFVIGFWVDHSSKELRIIDITAVA
jgi:hypothetical protein